MDSRIGQDMYKLAEKLFPICRSITGDGLRQTLSVLNDVCDLTIHEVPTGTKAFDWVAPREWNIRDAYIADASGEKILDFKNRCLHVMGYSVPINMVMPLSELLPHLHSNADHPDTIPYVTSYYKENWGFCLSENQKRSLKNGNYHVVIDSTLEDGFITYGEILLPGKRKDEIFLSTYICHPDMANNELSGPCVTISLAKEIASWHNREYSYRIIFIPETIGSIIYLSRNFETMKQNIKAGFVISCVGDDRAYSYISSRYANTLADKSLTNILDTHAPWYKKYSFLQRGSDERQYCAPGVDLPVCGFCRSKYGDYPEYHTSADNLSIISPSGLQGAYHILLKTIIALEKNKIYFVTNRCEPQLGIRGLYPLESSLGSSKQVASTMNFLAYADGTNDLFDISNLVGVSVLEIIDIAKKCEDSGLCKIINE